MTIWEFVELALDESEVGSRKSEVKIGLNLYNKNVHLKFVMV